MISCYVKIHRCIYLTQKTEKIVGRKAGGNLIEANERMSVLLDNKCDTQNLKMKTLGLTQSPRKVCGESKELEEKTTVT